MKFIRFIISLLVLAAALAALLAIAAFSPLVQTWAARRVFAHRPGVHGSLGSLSAGFGEVDVTDLHLEAGGAILTLPSLQAQVPLTTSVWNRKAVVRSLVADGWTLDLRRMSTPEAARANVLLPAGSGTGTAQAETIPAKTVERVFRGLLSGWELPCAVSLDGVELDGDVLLAAPPGGPPVRIHVNIKGGGVAAGREGNFAIRAEVADPALPINGFAATGRLTVAMESPRIISRVEIKADLSANGESVWGDMPLSADLAAARDGGGEAYTLGLSSGSRHLADLHAHFPGASRRLTGTWKVDLRQSDLEPLARGQSLPPFVITGDGKFDTEAPFTQVRGAGQLTAIATHLGALSPSLDRLGSVRLDARFDLAGDRRSIRVDRLSASLGGEQGVIAVGRALQAFDFNVKTGDLKMANPHGDWMAVTIQKFPLDGLSNLFGGLTFSGSTAAGEFVIGMAGGAFTLSPKMPLIATGVGVSSAGRVLARGLELSLLLRGDFSSQGWRVECAPLTLSSAGRRLAAIEAKASWVAAADQPVEIAGTWHTDLDALASIPAIPGARWITGRSASGDFSVKAGDSTDIATNIAVLGHDPGHSATASLSADFYADGEVSFLVPVKIAFGSSVSDVSAEGTRTRGDAGSRLEVKLTGGKTSLEQLRVLAGALAAAGGGPVAPGGGRDRIPFWGNWTGRATVAFDQLTAGDYDFKDVQGTVDFDRGSLRLEGGRGALPQKTMATAEGTVSFDTAAKFPYALKARVVVDPVEAGPWFGPPPPGEDPRIEGRFTVERTFTGQGINLGDLAAFTQEEIRLTSASTGGIIRLLKTSMVDAVPEAATTVSDTLGSAGASIMSTVFGVKKDSIYSGRNPVGKTAEAVLSFANQISEIGYDQIAITAIRGYDRTIRLVKMEMIAPDEHLVGSGQITYVEGLPVSARPLSVKLQFGARNGIADLLSTAGLLSSRKDDLGYTMLGQPVRFGGTLEHIDQSAWHDLLVRATRQTKTP